MKATKKKRKRHAGVALFPLARIAADKGLSLAEVARRSGIPREYVSAIANGRSRPLWSTALALAEALGANLGDFAPLPEKPKRVRKNRLPVIKDGDLCSLHPPRVVAGATT